ncbi:hypothetical protein VSVS12_02722 [Vibrio scophthalmi]|uniref:hypothetical protein n=1 Tax=Vibrio scophthalmi TaxID=45658 RepID=UPI0008095B0D|nr:hypothetical protein [Vibrio scophthalmi]ANS86471.1 hypothetical protein VSVS12_02722 [Vibrio scophthalmi]
MNKLYSFKKETMDLKEITKKMDEANDRLSKILDESKESKGINGLKEILKLTFEIIRFRIVCSRLIKKSKAILR